MAGELRGKTVQPWRFRAKHALGLDPGVGGRFASRRRVKPTLEHRKCDAETYDQRRGAKRHHGKSPLLMLFDIRVHVYLRGKARFVPKAARIQTPFGTRVP
jgi:hypothetical protein